MRTIFAVLLVLGSIAVANAADSLPRGLVNARIWTGDPDQPWAKAMAWNAEHIVAIGDEDEVRRAAGDAPLIDAGGKLVVPGFIDSHVHFIDGGFRLASVQLRDAGDRGEFTARIAAFARTVPVGTWIQGGDWDHSLWGGELPTRAWIDAATPDHPVWVNRLDGHMALANSAALRTSRIKASAPASSPEPAPHRRVRSQTQPDAGEQQEQRCWDIGQQATYGIAHACFSRR